MASALVVYLAAHQNMLEQFGITTFTWGQWPNATQPSGMCTLIEWDTLQAGGAVALVGVGMMAVAWISHHGTAAVEGKPQSGDVRTVDIPVIDGTRKDDPK